MIDDLGGATSNLVKLALDVSVLRQKVIANNIANANTPGYVPNKVSFEEHLTNASINSPQSNTDKQLVMQVETIRNKLNSGDLLLRSGAESVMLDMEMAGMAENVIRYQALLTGLSKHSSIIKLAIHEGRQ